MKNKTLIAILLAVVITAGSIIGYVKTSQAQSVSAAFEGNFNVQYRIFTECKQYHATFTDVDSVDLVAGLTTDVFDWSDITSSASSTPTISYAYTSSSANDTLFCKIQAYDLLTGNFTTIDTVGLTILSTTNGGTTTYTQASMFAVNGYSPYIRFQIIQKAATNDQANNGTFEISVFGPPVITASSRWRQ